LPTSQPCQRANEPTLPTSQRANLANLANEPTSQKLRSRPRFPQSGLS
jgi:hypothetical protein